MVNKTQDIQDAARKYRTVNDLFSKAFRKEKDEFTKLKLLGSYLYLRKHNSLKLKTREEYDEIEDVVIYQWDSESTNVWLCCDRLLICDRENAGEQEFIVSLKDAVTPYFLFFEDPDYLFSFVKTLNKLEFKEEEFLALFDFAINESDEFGHAGRYFLPEGISEVFKLFLDEEAKTFIDPYGGLMEFATDYKDKQFVGYELNEQVRELAMFRMALAGVLNHTELNGGIEQGFDDRKFDAIVTFPPIGRKIRMNDGVFDGEEGADEMVLRRFGELTNEHGQLITIVPASFLSSEANQIKRLRSTITFNYWLDKIVYLPPYTFGPMSFAAAIIVLKKDRRGEMDVCYFDASKEGDNIGKVFYIDINAFSHLFNESKVNVTLEEIYAQNCSWNLQWYLEQKNAVYSEGYCVKKIADVMTIVPPQNRYDDTKGYLVGAGDLSKNVFDYQKKPEDFKIVDELGVASKITESVILLSMIREANPTYCEASESQPIFIKQNVVALRITNEVIDPGYLCLELSKRLKTPAQGAVIPRFSRTQILNTSIEFPSLEDQRSKVEQKNLFEAAKRNEQLTIIREKGLEDIIEVMKDEHLKNIHARKHALMQNTSSLALAWGDLIQYLESNNGAFDKNDIIGRRHPVSVKDLIDSITSNIRIIDNQAQHLTEVEYYWGDVEEFYIQDFITDYIKEHPSTLFRYKFDAPDTMPIGEYDKDGEVVIRDSEPNWKVRIPKNALRQVVDNIVSNAVSHGFIRKGKDYCIGFEYHYEFDDIVLDIFNNGEPMPEGVDTDYVKTYGSSTKLNQQIESDGKVHSGIGGYDILNILNKYNAEYEVFSTPEKTYTVYYTITFHNIIKGEIPFKQDEY